jgi:hypothetical protein
MKKIVSLVVVAMLVALSFPANAHQPTKVPRIGAVSGGGDPEAWTIDIDAMPPADFAQAFRQGLRERAHRAQP